MSTPAPSLRYEWFQSDSHVTISIFLKHVDPAPLSLLVTSTSLSLSVPTTASSTLSLEIDPLFHEIVVDTKKETHKSLGPNSTKIELVLEKAAVGLKWTALEAPDLVASGSSTVEPPTLAPTHAYPTSLPGSKPRTNWDAYVNDFQKEESALSDSVTKDPNAGGDKALNELFQKLYADATEDQRRAMIKSYQESNGTTLSTNWEEVSKGKVETKPPDSMVAKKWGM